MESQWIRSLRWAAALVAALSPMGCEQRPARPIGTGPNAKPAASTADTAVQPATSSVTAAKPAAVTMDQWWSDARKADEPDKPIAGTINATPRTIAHVCIRRSHDKYSWTFTTKKPDHRCSDSVDDDSVNFRAKLLRAGTFEKKMDQKIPFDEYHAYHHYEQKDGSPMSVNVEWEAKIVVDTIDTDDNAVSGWATFRFSDNKTEIAGTFEAVLCEWPPSIAEER